MNFQEMREAFLTETGLVDSELDDSKIAQWFNEAQLDLAWELGKAKKYIYENTNGGEYDLPDDCLRIVKCSAGYKINDVGKIEFDNDGNITLTYVGIPADFTATNLEQVSELHQSLHYLMVYFAASRYFDQESEGDTEESNHATKWMNYYLMGKNNAIARLRKLLNSSNTLEKWTVI